MTTTTSKAETPKQPRLPFALSKAKLQTFFVNEAGQTVSAATFKKHSGLQDFCETELGLPPSVFRKRKQFFGEEVEKLCAHYQIDIDELF